MHPDWAARPYWWDQVPPAASTADMPAQADVAIVGSGYCALSAARELARRGVSVVVLEARDPGFGASSRNHGMVGGGQKIPATIDRRMPPDQAAWVRRTGYESFVHLKSLIQDNQLQVDYADTGRFTAAHTPKAHEGQKRRAEQLQRDFGYHTRLVSRADQHGEIGDSPFYHGGLVLEESGGLHPAKLHRAFQRLAEQQGASVVGQAEVRRITGRRGGFQLATAKGTVRAAEVFVATNAYTGAVNPGMSPWVSRRVVPVTAYMITTEELPPETIARVLPSNRMCGDTKRSLFAFRLSPDRKRIIFAGRAKFRDIDERAATPILHRFLCSVWPALKPVRITHTWKGMVCFTFDDLPHMGLQDGIHYAAGCQGSGVAMMSYLGVQVAEKIASGAGRQCGLDGLPFPTRPFYTGKPWFLPAVGAYYKTRDAVDRRFMADPAAAPR